MLPAQEKRTLLVAAASDLAPLEKSLSSKISGYQVRFAFGSSGMLASQIRAGAPYDVMLSANERYVHELARDGFLVDGSVAVYGLGRLGLWSAGGRVRRLEDLASSRVVRVAIANPAHAPYGVAAREALERAGIWKALESRVVLGENVRQGLQFAESGNAEAALVAWSLVKDRGGILVPAELHAPIRQAGGMVKGSRQSALARRFLEFLTGSQGRKILEEAGFGMPDQNGPRPRGKVR